MKLSPAAQVSGLVTDAQGQPVASAQIFIGELPEHTKDRARKAVAQTLSDGTFLLTSLEPKQHTLGAYHPGFPPGSADVHPRTGETTSVTIALPPGCVVEGQATCRGEPLAGAEVTAGIRIGEKHRVFTTKAVLTDESGFYRLSNAIAGRNDIHVRVKDGRSQRMEGVVRGDLTPGETAVVNFDLGSGTSALEGYVSLNGYSLTGGRIAVWELQQPEARYYAEIDSDGYYRVDGIAPGRAIVKALSSKGLIVGQSRAEFQENTVTRHDLKLTE